MPEEPRLDLARHLLFDLLRAGAGIARQHESRADGDLGILAPRHREQRCDAEEDGEPGEHEHHRAIAESGANGVHGLALPVIGVDFAIGVEQLARGAPSRRRCCPATTTRSSDGQARRDLERISARGARRHAARMRARAHRDRGRTRWWFR